MARKGKTHSGQAALLGALLVALVVVLHASGALDPLERYTIDLRYRAARLGAEPMSPDICMVDIDDAALATVENWPWPRSIFARVLDELSQLGAATIATDITFSDPQRASAADGGANVIDHDAVLASSVQRSGRVILAVDLPISEPLGAMWRNDAGLAALDRLRRTLSRDLHGVSLDEVARDAGLDEARAAALRARPTLFKKDAAMWAVRELAREIGAVPTLEQLTARVAPSVGREVGDYPERLIIEQVLESFTSFSLARDRGLIRPDEGQWHPEDRPPIPVLTAGAAGLGLVTVDTGSDARVRRVKVLEETPLGDVVQFGLMAAMHFRGLRAADAQGDGGVFSAGKIELPAPDGFLSLDWPTSRGGPPETAWLDAWRAGADDPASLGHVPIGLIHDLAVARARILEQAPRLLELSETLAGDLGLDPAIEDLAETLRQEAEFQVEAMDGRTLDELTVEERAAVGPWVEWRLLDQNRAEFDRIEVRVRPLVEGKLVFIGWTATGAAADFVSTPLGAKTPGVMVHAVAANMFLTDRARTVPPGWIAYVLIVAMGAVTVLATVGAGATRATLLSLGVAGGYLLVAGVLMFNAARVIEPLAAPLLTIALVWAGCSALEAALSQAARSRLERQFKARVSGALVDRLIENPEAVSMQGEQREMTALFIDLAGFTALSEKLDGPRTVALLNTCMRSMTNILTLEHAYVNKFLGDGLMAFWSAFGADDQQAVRATNAATACQMALDALNETPQFEGLPRISSRIGIATGRVIVGDCGAPPELNDYTIIGDSVNLAARLESANKQFGTRILIDGRTRELLGDTALPLLFLGRITVVGQSRPVEIYEILPGDADPARAAEVEKATRAFAQGRLEDSLALWRAVVEKHGSCKLAERYLEALADPDCPRDGVLRLREK